MVYNRSEIVKRALASTRNTPAACQAWTRGIIGAPAVGDVDHDHDADAVDGWKSEPPSHRHTDRNPPAGVPVAWGGGSHGYGHRAISLGNKKIRTTDGAGAGHVATRDLDWPETQWGLHYLGWSDTMSGIVIPTSAPPAQPVVKKPLPKMTRGPRIDAAIAQLTAAMAVQKKNSARWKAIASARAALMRMKKWNV